MNVKKHWFLILIIIGVVLRVLTLGTVTYTDEVIYQWSSTDYSHGGFNFLIEDSKAFFQWTQPPLAPLAYRRFVRAVGPDYIKVLPFLFSLGSVFLTYLISKRLYGKATAQTATLLMLFCFWHILASQMLDSDGSIATLFYLLAALCLLDKRKHSTTLVGIFMGLALLTKYTAGMFMIVITAYLLMKDGLKAHRPLIRIYLVAGAIFSVFPITSFLIGSDYFLNTLTHASGKLGMISPRVIVYLLIWATPLLSMTPLYQKLRRKEALFWLWALVPVIILGFGDSASAFGRYLMVIIPPLVILSARAIHTAKIPRSMTAVAVLFCLGVLALLGILNTATLYLPHNIGSYVSSALSLQWNFFFPITGPSGPTFGVSFASIAVSVILAGILFALAVSLRSRRYFALFLAAALAFNILLVTEYVFHPFHPDVPGVTREVIDYYQDNNLQGPIVTNTYSLSFYLGKKMDDLILKGYGFERDGYGVFDPGGFNGHVLLIDFPIMPRDGLWEKAGQCEKVLTLASRGRDSAYIFRCKE